MKYDITAQPAERLRYSIRRTAIKAQVVIAAAKPGMRQSARDCPTRMAKRSSFSTETRELSASFQTELGTVAANTAIFAIMAAQP